LGISPISRFTGEFIFRLLTFAIVAISSSLAVEWE